MLEQSPTINSKTKKLGKTGQYKRWGGRRQAANAFTEQGMAILSGVLSSDRFIGQIPETHRNESPTTNKELKENIKLPLSILVSAENQNKGYGKMLIDSLKRNSKNLSGWVIDHNNDLKQDGETPKKRYLRSSFLQDLNLLF